MNIATKARLISPGDSIRNLKVKTFTNSVSPGPTMELITDLTPREQYFYFEGWVWGTNQGQRENEQLRQDHLEQEQSLWLIIKALRNDFTLKARGAK